MRTANRLLTPFLIFVVSIMFGSGCDSAGSEAGSGFVSVKFQVGSHAAQQIGKSAGDPVVIEKSNGTLSIDGIHLIVDKLKFEADDEACEFEEQVEDETGIELDDADDDCEEIETPPFFLDLPLPAGEVDLVQHPIAAGTYDKFEFEVDDIELDDDEDEVDVAGLVTEVRTLFPDWPEEASARIAGSFAPVGDNAVPFTAYLKAEIEVEMAIEPALVVDEAGSNRPVVVVLEPAAWFVTGDEVLDLSDFDYANSNELLEMSLKMKDGFELRVEAEDD